MTGGMSQGGLGSYGVVTVSQIEPWQLPFGPSSLVQSWLVAQPGGPVGTIVCGAREHHSEHGTTQGQGRCFFF